MVSVTFSVPDDIKGLMKELAWVNWSEIAREDLLKRIKAEHMREQLKSPDEQSFINWSVELGRKAKSGRWSRMHSKSKELK